MGSGFIRAVLCWCFSAFVLGMAVPAHAAGSFAPGSVCHVSVGEADLDGILARPSRWACQPRDWSISERFALIRFDLRGAPDRRPKVAKTRIAHFKSMRIIVIAADGTRSERTVREGDVRFSTSDWEMFAPLPEYRGDADAVVVEIDQPARVLTLSSMRVQDTPHDTPQSLALELMIAACCGILVLPLVFNFAFYRVLRERFLLWHVLAVVFMLTQTFVTSGLVNRFFSLSLSSLVTLAQTSFCAATIAAALVAADMIEPGKLNNGLRTALRCVVFWGIPAQLIYFHTGPLRAWVSDIYYISSIPVLAIYVLSLASALRNGSRSARFLVVAWAPLLALAIARVVSAMGATDSLLTLQFPQHLALTLEVVFTSLAVADRFMAIKRQRDRAYEESRLFERMAERDALTGLFNRRIVDQHFHDLRDKGYTTLAVIDLDHFKSVNDTYGHAMGDNVLRAVAEVLSQADGTLAFRLGGEEFLLLLNGTRAIARAEQIRCAIPICVSRSVIGLDRPVTASMGIVQIPKSAIPNMTFPDIFHRADKLLYEAKSAGRNRSVSERLQSFRRPVAAVAA